MSVDSSSVLVSDGAGPQDVQDAVQFAAALTRLRLEQGLSIRALARRTGIPSATLGGYFSGRHLPPATQPQVLASVLDALGVQDPVVVAEWREAALRARRSGARMLQSHRERPAAVASPAVCPYRGLEPFTEDDAELFYGREAVAASLAQALIDRADDPAAAGLMVLVGPSGSGKSSVLRAGLVPLLRHRREQGWAVAVMVPGVDPQGALVAAEAELAGARRGLLVVDQAEEIFSPDVSPESRRSFLRGLGTLVAADGAADRRVVAVLGLRADRFGQAAGEAALLPALQTAQMVLGAMTQSDLRRAVAAPAESAGVTVDPALLDLLVQDLTPRGAQTGRYEPGALPLVSHALLSAWNRHSGTQLTVADYLAVGGISGAVQQTAEGVYGRLDETGRSAAQWLFTQLVVVDEDGVMARRRLRHDDLSHPDPATDFALDAVIEAFIAGRLITAGEATLEISHEALLTAWPRLRGWVSSDLDAARLQRRIGDAAAVWREHERDPSLLLRGGPLTDAQALAQRPPSSPRTLTSPEREFVAASLTQREQERADQRRSTRRLRVLLSVMTTLAVLAGALAAAAVIARNQTAQARDEALSRQLAITAEDARDSDPALAAQLSLAAYRVAPTVQARSALLDSTAVPTPQRFVGPAGDMHATASPDGRLLAISGVDGVTRLQARTSEPDGAGPVWRPVGELPAPGAADPIYASAFSPDGRRLAVGGGSGRVALWDLGDAAAPQQLALLEIGSTVKSLAFSPDGGQLAAATTEPSLRRWQLEAGGPRELAAVTDAFGGAVNAVAYAPTSDLLATGSADATIRIWRAGPDGTAQLLGEAVAGQPSDSVYAVAFSPDSATLAAGYKGRVARLWDLRDPTSLTQIGEPLGEFDSWVNSVAFSPDGSAVAAGSSDGDTSVFDIATGGSLLTLPSPSPVTSVEYVADSGLLTSEVGGVARLWPMPGPLVTGFTDSVWSLPLTADGASAAIAPGASDGSLHLFDIDGGYVPTGVLTPPAEVGPGDGAAAMSADGRWLAVGTPTGHVAVWERSGDAAPTLAGTARFSQELVEALSISADGTLLSAVADDGAVGLWRLQPGAAPAALPPLAVPGLPLSTAFSPDAGLLAVGTTDAVVHLWRVASDGGQPAFEELAPLTGFENYVYGLAFDPSGRYLTAGSTDRTIRIWDVSDPQRIESIGDPIRGPRDTVYALSWSADGTLAAASKEGAAWLWQMADPQQPDLLATLQAAPGGLYTVALRNDGVLSAGGTEPVVTTWRIDDEAAADWVCASTGTSLSPAEWEQNAPGIDYAPPCPA